MTRRYATTALLAGFLSLTNGCQNYLDVNTNPNAPETVSANLYLSPMEIGRASCRERVYSSV